MHDIVQMRKVCKFRLFFANLNVLNINKLFLAQYAEELIIATFPRAGELSYLIRDTHINMTVNEKIIR